MPRQSSNVFDLVAQDLADWLDKMGEDLAGELIASGNAPFSAPLSESQKLDYYRSQLFNPDGQPNLKGRNDEMTRLGPSGFAMVFKAVTKAFPDLVVPTPPPGAIIPEPLAGPPQAIPRGPTLPQLPNSLTMPRNARALSELTQVGPPAGQGPLG